MYLFNTLFLALFCFVNCVVKKYDNYTLFRGVPENREQLNFLLNLKEKYDVNFWKKTGLVNTSFDFSMRPDDVDAFLEDARGHNITVTTMLKDIQRAFDEQTVKTYIRRNMDSFNWRHYYRLKDIYNWLLDLCSLHDDEMEMIKIGKTINNRDIVAIKLVLKGSMKRSKVIIEGGIHAREWISPAFVTYMINALVNAPRSKNKALKTIALTYEWYFVPVLNADGYEISHTKDRLWRKNARGGYGVDLNRNFGIAFGTVGVSFNKYRDDYCGETEFSEPESMAMAKFVTEVQDNLEYYIGFHSYGQYFILPYAYSMSHLDNFDVVHKMGLAAAKQISKRYGTKYTVGTAFDTVGYVVSGASTCWAKNVFGIPYAATLELRDEGVYGFALPPSLILPTCQETMDGLISFLTPRSGRSQIMSDSYNTTDKAGNIVASATLVGCLVLRFLL